MNVPIRMLSIVGLIAGLAAPAQAALIAPASAIASSEGHSSRKASNLINGAEMNVPVGQENDYTKYTMDAGTTNAGTNVAWQSNGSNATHWAIIDLGATYNLETISIWNLNPSVTSSTYTGREVRTVNVWYSTTGAGAANIAGQNIDTEFNSTGYTSLTTGFGLTQNPGATGPIAAPNGVLTGVTMTGVQAQWVAIEITDSYGNANIDKKGTLSEVQFFGTPVPEPSSLALLAAGGLMMIKRRRRD